MSSPVQDGVLVCRERLPEATVDLWAHSLTDEQNLKASVVISNNHNVSFTHELGNMFIRPQPKVTTIQGRVFIVFWTGPKTPQLAVYDINECALCAASAMVKEEPISKGIWYHFNDEFCGETSVLFSTDTDTFTVIREAEL